MSLISLLRFLLFAWLSASAAHASGELRIGVLAHRGAEAAVKSWQPTADYLGEAIPGQRFVVRPHDLASLEQAVASGEVDFVFTNPEQYIVLEARHRVTRIATLLRSEGGLPLKAFGGVIFARADRGDIRGFADIAGKTVAAVDGKAFGGYLMQAGELLGAGIDVREKATLKFLGLPQDRIVQAVAEGSADVGFVRSGLLESMEREGKLHLADFRVLGLPAEPGYPLKLSTRLYPEWPFSVLAHTPSELASLVAKALFDLPAQSAAARAGEYHGWTVPMSYRGVHDLMRSLQIAPYDKPADFRLQDVLRKYDLQAIAGLSLLLLLALAVAVRMQRMNRALSGQFRLVEQRTGQLEREMLSRLRVEQQLADRNAILERATAGRPLADLMDDLVLLCVRSQPDFDVALLVFSGEDGRPLLAASAGLPSGAQKRIVAIEWSEKVAGEAWRQRIEGVARDDGRLDIAAIEPVRGAFDTVVGCLMLFAPKAAQACPDAEVLQGIARLAGLLVDKRRAEERQRLNTSVFDNAQEGILVTDAENRIVHANPAFTRLTGYALDEVIGKNPRLLKSGRQDEAFYDAMWAGLREYGQWRGEVWNRRKDGGLYAEILHVSVLRDDEGRVTHYVGTFSDITHLKETEARLARMAHTDALTGLPNRVLLTDRLNQAMAHARRRERLLAVCYLDLDGFKPVNDLHGHEAGDRLLTEVAGRLSAALRAGDTVARMGGDEFVLLLTDLKDVEELGAGLERIMVLIARPYDLGHLSLALSASVGVTLYPLDDAAPEVLLRHADQAMYQAKRSGRNCFHLFDARQDQELQSLARQHKRIAHALRGGELRLVYQPKVNLRSGELVGLEALLRWASPEEGIRLPQEFLPFIEHHDLICEIGEWALAAALEQMEAWAAGGNHWSVSVNIAARHFLRPDFVASLKALLEAHSDLPRGCLELEILESAALDDVESMRKVIDACHALGVRFALDDFGAGYATLTYLRELPADTLKIDRSFISRMMNDKQSLAIVDGIISLGNTFDRHLIAEGVETPEQGAMLLRLGCGLAQGHAIAAPMAGGEVPAWADAFRPDETWTEWAHWDWRSKDIALLTADVEHRRWVAEVLESLAHPHRPLDAEEVGDGHRCGFGRWYHGHGRERYGRLAEFRELGQLHEQVHEAGLAIVRLMQQGRQDEARRAGGDLEALRDRMLAHLAALQRLSVDSSRAAVVRVIR